MRVTYEFGHEEAEERNLFEWGRRYLYEFDSVVSDVKRILRSWEKHGENSEATLLAIKEAVDDLPELEELWA